MSSPLEQRMPIQPRGLKKLTASFHADGFGRILVCDLDLSEFQVGRTLQRLLEMDTYRILALLSLRSRPSSEVVPADAAAVDPV